MQVHIAASLAQSASVLKFLSGNLCFGLSAILESELGGCDMGGIYPPPS